MGWTVYHRRPADPRAELRSLVTRDGPEGSRRPLADAFVGSTWYAAVEDITPDGAPCLGGRLPREAGQGVRLQGHVREHGALRRSLSQAHPRLVDAPGRHLPARRVRGRLAGPLSV